MADVTIVSMVMAASRCGGQQWPVWWLTVAGVVTNSGRCGDQQWPLWWPLQWPTVAGVGLTVAGVVVNSG